MPEQLPLNGGAGDLRNLLENALQHGARIAGSMQRDAAGGSQIVVSETHQD